VTLLCQKYLYEIGRNDEIDCLLGRLERQPFHEAERLTRVEAAFHEVAAQDLFGYIRAREACERPANVTSRVSQLQAAG